jgi:hypothetical protein
MKSSKTCFNWVWTQHPQPGVCRQLAVTISYIATFATHNLLVAKKLLSEICWFVLILFAHRLLWSIRNLSLNLSTPQKANQSSFMKATNISFTNVKDNEKVWRCREYQKKRCKSYIKTSRNCPHATTLLVRKKWLPPKTLLARKKLS